MELSLSIMIIVTAALAFTGAFVGAGESLNLVHHPAPSHSRPAH